MNKKIGGVIIAIVAVAIVLCFSFPVFASVNNPTAKEVDLKMSMRKLWEDHVTWIRMVVVGIVDKVPGTDQATERLLQNYNDMEAKMKPFYGDKEAGVFGDLMKNHLVIAVDLTKASAAGDSVKVGTLEKQWYENARAICVQLNKMNPKNWPLSAMETMMNEHLQYTKAELLARITKDYTADIKAYDYIHEQALMMADELSDGIIKQYPNKVKNVEAEPSAKIFTKAGFGKYLVNSKGMTLYFFAKDSINKSNCSDMCAVNWPPLSVAGRIIAGTGVKGVMKKIERTDGSYQITYLGKPLYTWIGDKVVGDMKGEGVGGVWSVAKP